MTRDIGHRTRDGVWLNISLFYVQVNLKSLMPLSMLGDQNYRLINSRVQASLGCIAKADDTNVAPGFKQQLGLRAFLDDFLRIRLMSEAVLKFTPVPTASELQSVRMIGS